MVRIKVASLDSGRVLFENSAKLLHNLKHEAVYPVARSASPDYRRHLRLCSLPADAAGIVGDLTIYGRGDPSAPLDSTATTSNRLTTLPPALWLPAKRVEGLVGDELPQVRYGSDGMKTLHVRRRS